MADPASPSGVPPAPPPTADGPVAPGAAESPAAARASNHGPDPTPAEPPAPAPPPEPRPAPGARRALALLTGLNLLNYMDRFVVAAVLPQILLDLRISDARGGLVQSVFILSFALISPVVGWLGDRMRRLPLAAAGVVVWSLATVASGLAPSFAFLIVARAVIGIGEACYGVVTPSLLADWYPPSRRGRALAVFYAAIPVGSALGYVIGGQLGGAFGWRVAFFAAGAPGAVLGLALLWLREPARGGMDMAGAFKAIALPLRAALREMRRRHSYLFNTGAQTMYTFAIGGLAFWMPTYFIRERGIPQASAATTFGILLLVAGFIGTLAGGQLGDRLAKRIPGAHFSLSAVALLASLPFSILAVLAPAPVVFWPAMFVTLTLLFLNTGPLNAAMANVLPAHLRARGFAFYTMAIHLLGDGPSPFLIGRASDSFGLTLPVLAMGVLMASSGVVLALGRRALVRDLSETR